MYEENFKARHRVLGSVGMLLLICLIVHLSSLIVLAQPTQQEVFRSIGQNMDRQKGDPTKLLALLAAAAGLAVLLVLLSFRHKREVTTKVFNHHGKLLKEISRSVGLKPAEVRQLKLLAEAQDLTSPLTLILCPSQLTKAVRERGAKVDEKVITQLARRIEQPARVGD